MASFHLQEQIAKHLEKYPAIWNSKGGEKSNRDKVAYQWKQLAADVGSDEGAIKKSYNTLRSRFRSVSTIHCYLNLAVSMKGK